MAGRDVRYRPVRLEAEAGAGAVHDETGAALAI